MAVSEPRAVLRDRWWSTSLVLAWVCCLPAGVLIMARAPGHLLEAFQAASQMSFIALTCAHLVAAVLLLVSIAGYVHWLRHTQYLTSNRLPMAHLGKVASARSQKRVVTAFASSTSTTSAAGMEQSLRYRATDLGSPSRQLAHRSEHAPIVDEAVGPTCL